MVNLRSIFVVFIVTGAFYVTYLVRNDVQIISFIPKPQNQRDSDSSVIANQPKNYSGSKQLRVEIRSTGAAVFQRLLHVQRKYKKLVNCTAIVDEKNIEEIAKADMITRSYREYRDMQTKREPIISKEYLEDLKMIPDENYIFDKSKCKEFTSSRGYYIYSMSKEEIAFPLAFSMLTYEHAEQFERLLRVIYRPQNAYCIHVDSKSNKTFQKAVESIVQCFPNVFIATKRERVYWGDISRLQADINCIHDFMMAAPDARLPFNAKSPENMTKFWSHQNMMGKRFRNDWKYILNLASTEFPIRTNRELVQILKIYNGTNDIDYIKFYERERVNYRWEFNSSASIRTFKNESKQLPPYNYTIVKGMTYSTLSRAFAEYVLNSVEARALLSWLEDTFVPDEFYWGTLHYSTVNKAPGGFQTDSPPKGNEPHMSRFMGWPWVYQCDKAGRRRRHLCILTNGDLNHVTNLPHFFMNKFLLNDDPVAYACVEDWYARRHARENELTTRGEKIINAAPYCQYLHRLSGRIYKGCEKFKLSLN